ncbi:MAG: glycosyltransferase family 2 protein [Clostridia bacterium]|nr:glycosyltransferase family 2 protein [Clostridia bacterium]MBQ2346806.1 glycosyltransferase family 2 protein [Clostridia bacterium]
MDLISIVVPCYNEQEALPAFYKEIVKTAKQMNDVRFEFIFVDDGSKDKTLPMLKFLHKKDSRVRYISFSRNFGKEAGMLAGLQAAKGDYIAVMDADLQDPPSLLPEMYETVKSGEYDCAATRRTTREGEPPIRSFFAKMFYKIINKMSDADIVDGARDFRLMRRKMVDAILSMSEYNRFSKGIFGWVGFKTKWFEYVNAERVAGQTKWSFWKLFKYSMEGIMAFSTTPLYVSSIMGFIICLFAFIMACFYLIKTLAFGDPTTGFPSLVCIMLFLGGIQLIGIGVVGMYLSKTYLETKNRPIYIIKETETEK